MYKEKPCLHCKNKYTPNSSRQKYCENCKDKVIKIYKKKWREKNREKDNETKRNWYWNNLEKARSIKRKWNWSDGGVEYRKKYAQENKDIIYERLKKYKKANKSRIKANHIIKKNNIERVCEECGSKKRVQIHHKDKNPMNNDLSNLSLLCLEHHKLKHHHKIQE